ncbi:AlpA family phage regulatory protein [Hyphomicrobium sp. NDB2Meth4]|uniref:helix-turn-helix transcriptional regulator n=1 Tax=Hyphomicrobium sp. NDB2Meth4 TaxID=1892846 RepID=UPI000930242C|nr:AlpA family phage regulatory protein [Hyphomicrobium sp. NDB2Meth4]
MAKPSKPSDNICLDAHAVRHCVSYSLNQLTRLEAAGKFPRRIRLGARRMAWAFRDVLDWMQAKVDTRPVGPLSPKIVIDTGDRFIRIKELRSIVLFHPNHIRNLEREGKFPGRIYVSDVRVVWLEREIRDWLEAQRQRAEAAATLKTYHVRLCRPRFEVADVIVQADSPGSAERTALETVETSKPGWCLLPHRPESYQPHVQMSVLEETPTYAAEVVRDILSKYEAKYVRYLLLHADTNMRNGTVLLQPWFTHEELGSLAGDLANDWVAGFDRKVTPIRRRGRPSKKKTKAAHPR